MYKTIYRFRVRVEGNAIQFPLHLCIYQNEVLKFNDLFDKMRNAASKEDINMSDYYITTEKSNTQQGGAMLHDDQSLRDALNAVSERHYMELVLRNKRARTLSPPLPTWRRESVSSFPVHPRQASNDVPVIKPNAFRWSPVHNTEMRLGRYSLDATHDTDGTNDDSFSLTSSIRKDSGISLGDSSEMTKMDIDSDVAFKTLKLPNIHQTPEEQQQHRSSLFESPPIIHPLDLRRTSTTMPPSPSLSLGAPIKLPAITSLTKPNQQDDHHHHHHPSSSPSSSSQLAPIHRHFSYDDIRTPPQTPSSSSHSAKSPPPPPLSPCNPGSSNSSNSSGSSHSNISYHRHPAFTFAGTSSPNSAMIPVAGTSSSSMRRVSKCKSSSGSAPGQFLCEHLVDPASGRICGQTFRRSYDLSRHQSIHMKNRPFCYCSQCGKKFTRMDALRRHERVQGHNANKRHHTTTGQDRHHHRALPHQQMV